MEKPILLKKQEDVSNLLTRLNQAKVVIAFDYKGLSVKKFTDLRLALRKSGCEVEVLKNNISRRASQAAGYETFAQTLTGPKALVFSNDDVVAPAKALYEFAKLNKEVKIGSGIVEKQEVGLEKIKELATLPSYETLLTMLAAGMFGTLRQLSIGLNLLTENQEA